LLYFFLFFIQKYLLEKFLHHKIECLKLKKKEFPFNVVHVLNWLWKLFQPDPIFVPHPLFSFYLCHFIWNQFLQFTRRLLRSICAVCLTKSLYVVIEKSSSSYENKFLKARPRQTVVSMCLSQGFCCHRRLHARSFFTMQFYECHKLSRDRELMLLIFFSYPPPLYFHSMLEISFCSHRKTQRDRERIERKSREAILRVKKNDSIKFFFSLCYTFISMLV
jgi:hypothetical protein